MISILGYTLILFFIAIAKQSATSGSTSSSFVATPLPLHQSQTTLADLLSDNKATQDPPTGTTATTTARSTTKKRKVVSFADFPSSSSVEDGGKDKDDIIIISPDLPTVPSTAPVLSATSSTGGDSKGEAKMDTPQVVVPKVTISPAPAKKSVAATSKGGEGAPTLQEAGKTVSDDRSHLPSPLRDVLSDEESVASSVSSLASDSSLLVERPLRRRRGGRRRGGGRGKKAAVAQDQSSREETDIVGEGGEGGGGGEVPKTSRRGGRGRRRGGRGARTSPPELTRSFSVEVVETSLKAEG